MGNRATVVFTNDRGELSPAIYLHWNGGPESVYAFLAEHVKRGNRLTEDVSYCAARFVQVVGDFFGHSSTSLGMWNLPAKAKTPKALLKAMAKADAGNENGVYLVTWAKVPGDTHGLRTLVVRRFFTDYQQGATEADADFVATERAEAEAHDYAPALAAQFEKILAARAAVTDE